MLSVFMKTGLLVMSLLSTSACVYLQQTTRPIQSHYYYYDQSSTTLVLLLPGLGEYPEQFVKQGIVDQLTSCRADANILGVNSHFGYYREASLLQRLQQDIIDPAKDEGIRQFWLLGVSLGGLGSLMTYRDNFETVQGAILMAPYIGDEDALSAFIANPEKPQVANARQVELWRWLNSESGKAANITLTYGDGDRLNAQHEWLAGLLDKSNVVKTAGKHNWSTWKLLWPEALLQSGICVKASS